MPSLVGDWPESAYRGRVGADWVRGVVFGSLEGMERGVGCGLAWL